MCLNLISNCFLLLFGFILIYQDFRESKVGIIPVILFFLSCLGYYFINREICLVPAILFFAIGGLFFILKKQRAFGIADYIVIISISFALPQSHWPEFLTICGGIGVLTSLYFKDKKFPFIPSILISLFIIKIFFKIN